MFDDVTRRGGDGRAARRLRFALLAALVHSAALATAGHLLARRGANAAAWPAVPVIIVRSPPSTPPLRPPVTALEGRPRAAPALTPGAERPRSRPKVSRVDAPPRQAPAEEVAAPRAPDEDARAEVEASPPSAGGGEARRAEEGAAAAERGVAPGPAPVVEDEPLYAGAGFRRPHQAQRDCVQNSVRIPSGLRGFASGPVTAKFAVGADGAPTSFELVGDVPDARIGAAIWQAIQSCRWIAGSDAQGRPAKLWVIMPIRFQAGS